MKLFRIVILLIVAFSLGVFLRPSPSYTVEEGENTFSSHFYTDYHQQLNDFLKHYPNSLQLGPATEPRKTHEAFVQQLRERLGEPGVDDLVRWIFVGAQLTQSAENYFYNIVSPETEVSSYLQQLTKDKGFSGLKHKNLHQDHYLHGNLPYLLFAYPNAKSTHVFRMGNPLGNSPKIDWPWTSVVVYPEFLRFLEVQPNHLYVHLMRRHGIEGIATKVLEKLENQYPSLSIVTLDRDSPFYWQEENEYPHTMNSQHFKAIFHEKMMAKEGAYFWSSKLDRFDWSSELKALSNSVHKKYFNDRDQLTRQERQSYIELTYLAILDRLVEILEPNSMNITCRQCMDRAPSLYVLWMVQKKLITDREAAALLLTPPLLVNNRSSHASRIERYSSAAKMLTL